MVDGQCVGGIGVSGGTEAEDVLVAQAGVDALARFSAMTTTAQSAAMTKLDYSHGKQLAQQIFHETMAAIDVRHAMLAKLKFEGGALIGRGSGASSCPPAARGGLWQGGKSHGHRARTKSWAGGLKPESRWRRPKRRKKLANFHYFVGGHPYPNAGSLEGARASLELVSHLTREDTVIFLVSGGGSAILAQPMDAEHHARRFEGVQPRAGDLPPSH